MVRTLSLSPTPRPAEFTLHYFCIKQRDWKNKKPHFTGLHLAHKCPSWCEVRPFPTTMLTLCGQEMDVNNHLLKPMQVSPIMRVLDTVLSMCSCGSRQVAVY